MTSTSRGRAWAIVAPILVGLTLVVVAIVPVPYLAQSPGPVFDILGENDGKPVLQIEGARSYETTGSLDMTTVAESGGDAGLITAIVGIAALFEPETTVVPDEDYLNGISRDNEREFQEQVFDASQSDALGAAADYLQRPVNVQPVIMEVVPGSGADGKLESGDAVLTVNGQRVRDASDVGGIIRDEPVGTQFVFDVRRPHEGDARHVSVTSGPDPDDPVRAVVGVVVSNRYTSDFRAVVNLSDIGGPSAGLMLALGMVDRLTPGDLVEGRHVAGTGTIDGRGRVGPIGGIDKKMLAAQAAGAELFLAPIDNCDVVLESAPDGLPVVPVRTLRGAVAAIDTWKASGDLPTCPSTTVAQGNG